MTRLVAGTCCVLAVALAGCERDGSEITLAEATILNTHGDRIGSATFFETIAGTKLHLVASHLDPGVHAIHIHEGTFCGAPTFESAHGHFNPEGRAHGFDAQGGPHAGDLPNLEVGEDGTVEFDGTLANLDLRMGAGSILGKTVVIHAGPDDYVSQPAGNSGERIACGVIRPSLASYAPATG